MLRMPAEWERHEATWIAWPHNRDDWPGKFEPIPWVCIEVIRHLHFGENISLLVRNDDDQAEARTRLTAAGVDMNRVSFSHIPTNRIWTRDYVPTAVLADIGTPTNINWRFNAWAKYEDWQLDNAVGERICEARGTRQICPQHRDRHVVLEGGAIEVNGQGLLMTTEECLLSTVQERNPGFSANDYESVFREYLGVEKVIWLAHGIVGDDTHGHIDDLARFVGPNTVVTVVEDNMSDDNYGPLQENLQRLRSATNSDGRPLEVVDLPMPSPLTFEGRRLPASYANFYIGNECVLVPTFNDVNDRVALNVLSELFPSRRVVGIHAVDLVWGLGTIHCMTQQQPKVD